MITDFQKSKLLYLFKFLDLDSNQSLELDDFTSIADAVARQWGHKPDSNEYQLLMAKAEKLFHHLAQDIASDDQKITEKEWLRFFEKEVIDSEDDLMLDEYIELILSYVFGFTDANHDGFISREEYQDLFSTFKVKGKHSEQAFSHMDANNDERLSRYELKDAIETFLTSNDPEERSNWIFGDWKTDPR